MVSRLKHNFYPYFNYLLNMHRNLSGQQCGTLPAYFMSTNKYSPESFGRTVTGKMPNYHKLALDPNSKIEYHLSGYGTYYEESFIKYIGEGIERYALMVAAKVYEDKIVYATYNDLEKEKCIIPFECLELFSSEDYQRLKKLPSFPLARPSEDKVYGWIKCPSLFESSLEIWIPAQLLFVGYKVKLDKGEERFSLAFSKGTASHTDINKAMINALNEWVESDAFGVKWYTKQTSPLIIIDDLTLLKSYEKILSEDSIYNVIPLYLSLSDLPIHVFGIILMRKEKKSPYMMMGVQADLNPRVGFYRGLIEATTIMQLGIYGYIYSPNQYLLDPEKSHFTDLDTNVAYYSRAENIKLKNKLVNSLTEGSITLSSLKDLSQGSDENDLSFILKALKNVSKYAVYLDITPPEIRNKGWFVIRTFIPELYNMCLPGYPYTKHSRIIQYGGIKNEYPHPLP